MSWITSLFGGASAVGSTGAAGGASTAATQAATQAVAPAAAALPAAGGQLAAGAGAAQGAMAANQGAIMQGVSSKAAQMGGMGSKLGMGGVGTPEITTPTNIQAPAKLAEVTEKLPGVRGEKSIGSQVFDRALNSMHSAGYERMGNRYGMSGEKGRPGEIGGIITDLRAKQKIASTQRMLADQAAKADVKGNVKYGKADGPYNYFEDDIYSPYHKPKQDPNSYSFNPSPYNPTDSSYSNFLPEEDPENLWSRTSEEYYGY